MPKVDAFNQNIIRYEKWFEENQVWYIAEVEGIRNLLPHRGLGIEIGVGTGRFAILLNIPIGVDPSYSMISIAKKRGVKCVIGVGEDLPFLSSVFDYALMVTTICFLDDIPKAFKETYRVLKHRGVFVIGFVDKDTDLGRMYLAKKEDNPFYKDAEFLTSKDVEEYLKESNFTNIHKRQIYLPVFSNLPIDRAEFTVIKCEVQEK